ncbi:MAG: hypothetical protein IKS42_04030 [Oscillospiraceae bacterium]|nr:hypothetical protein [Oscillospiraceae bacterium]
MIDCEVWRDNASAGSAPRRGQRSPDPVIICEAISFAEFHREAISLRSNFFLISAHYDESLPIPGEAFVEKVSPAQ